MNISSIFMLNQQGNYAVPMEEQLPLVAREHLSEEDHANILKRMVVGKIASQVNYRGRKNGLQPKKEQGRSKPFFRAL